MFQSAGLFRDISCPYFIFGLCERPYCHFKHSKHDEAKAKATVSHATTTAADTTVGSNEDKYSLPANALERTLKDIEENIKNEKNKLKGKSAGVSSGSSVVSKPSIKTKPTGTPEYNPTPISQLKKQKDQGKYNSSKYELALLDGPSSEQEYDPASNYTTSFKGTVSDVPEYAATLHGMKRPVDEDAKTESPVAKIPKFVSVEYTPSIAEPVLSDDEPVGDQADWFSEEESAKDSTSDVADNDSDSQTNIIDSVADSVTKVTTCEDKDVSKTELPFEFTPEGFIKPPQVEKPKVKTELKHTKTSEKQKIEDKDESTEEIKESKKTFKESKKEIKEKVEECEKDKAKKSIKDSNIFSIFMAAAESVLSKHDDKNKSEHKIGDKISSDTGSSEVKANKHTHTSSSSSNSKNVDKHRSHESHTPKKSSESSSTSKSNIKTKTINEQHKSDSRKENKKDKQTESKVNTTKGQRDNSKSIVHHKTAHLNHKSKHTEDKTSHVNHTSKSSGNSSTHLKHRLKETDKKSSHSSKQHDKTSKQKDRAKDLSSHVSSSNSAEYKGKLKSDNSLKADSFKSKEDKKLCVVSKKRRKSSDKVRKLIKTRKIVDLNVDLFGADSDTETKEKESSDKTHKKSEPDTTHVDYNDIDLDDIELQTPSADEQNEFSDLEKYFSDEDPFDECLRIFNEEGANIPSTSGAEKKKVKRKESDNSQESSSAKKRIGLKPNDPTEKKRTLEDKPKPKPSPAQVMMNRYKRMQQQALEAEEREKNKLKEKVRKISAQNAMNAPQPKSKTIADAGSSFSNYLASKTKSPQKKTTAITVAKGQKRKAHTPTVPVEKLKRPVVEVSTSSKVPTNIRQRYLNLMIDECLKLYKNEKEAFQRATEEEAALYAGISSKSIYLNKAVNTIKRLRTEVENKASTSKDKHSSPVKMSHVAMLDGASATKTSYTLHRSGGAVKIREEDFTGLELYERLKPYILTEEQLNANNFPRPDPASGGMAVFLGEDIHAQKARTKGYEKICVRCGKIFEVYPNGKYPKKEECVYHWGKAFKKKIAGALETRYTCCSGDLGSEGCQVCKAHVHETNKKENLSGYMKTIPCSPPPGGDYGVYALDCEMVYTTQGVELARVTVVGSDMEPMYETLVKPDRPVVDYNTRFSGITEEDLEDVTTTLRDVQAVLLSLFTAHTILIGHSLESDLTALKLIHSCVVDTSMVFPHRLGLPYKRALKNLMAEYLKKIIQDDVAGHDSHEDAISCLQLMQLRLKEDMRKEGRR